MVTAAFDAQNTRFQHALHPLQPLRADTRRGSGADRSDYSDRGFSIKRVRRRADAQPVFRGRMANVRRRFRSLRSALRSIAGDDPLLAGMDGGNAGLRRAVAPFRITPRDHSLGLRHGRCRLGVCDAHNTFSGDMAPQATFASLWRGSCMVLGTAASISRSRF